MEFSEIDNSQEIDAAEAGAVVPPPEVGYCLNCGYDMRGLGVQKCPECGTVFDVILMVKHNEGWCRDLVQQMRITHLVTAVGCVHALYYMLTGGLEPPLMAIVGILGLAIAVLYTLAWLPTSHYAPNGQRGVSFAHRCGRGVAIAAAVLVGVPVVVASGWLGVIMTLAAGLLLSAMQAQRFVEGKRRGYLFGLANSLAESVAFAVGVSKFFGAVAVILLIAALAVR